jgi:hypothetical protein
MLKLSQSLGATCSSAKISFQPALLSHVLLSQLEAGLRAYLEDGMVGYLRVRMLN